MSVVFVPNMPQEFREDAIARAALFELMPHDERRELMELRTKRDVRLLLAANRAANRAADGMFELAIKEAQRNGYIPKRQQEQSDTAEFRH